MTFNDIFKSNFMEKIGSFSLIDAAIVLMLAFVIGLFIFIVYRKTYSGIMYNSGFGVSLIGLSMITSFVILAVTSNVVLSLGMVGALSIVRFRTAIKESMDIVFLFWAIATGIVLGAGLIPLAVIGSIIIGVVIVVFSNIKYNDTPYILVIHAQNSEVDTILPKLLQKYTKKNLLKSKTASQAGVEFIYEVRVKENNSNIINVLSETEGITDVSLVSYNGEYMS